MTVKNKRYVFHSSVWFVQLSSQNTKDEQDGYEMGEDLEAPLGHTKEVDELLPTSVRLFRYGTLCCTHFHLHTKRSNLQPAGLPKRRLKRPIVQKRDWAHVIDVNTPLSNFHELVPEMAHKVPFFCPL